jgi:hypothetical protein
MHTVIKISSNKFNKVKNPNISGCYCADCGTFIDYKAECYHNRDLNIFFCPNCKTPKQNKYRNIPREYNGVIYQSSKEARYAKQLDLRLRAKEISGWKRQVKIPLYGAEGKFVCNYYVDFQINHLDGTTEYIEIKSTITMTPMWQIKWKLFEQQTANNPLIKLTVVK